MRSDRSMFRRLMLLSVLMFLAVFSTSLGLAHAAAAAQVAAEAGAAVPMPNPSTTLASFIAGLGALVIPWVTWLTATRLLPVIPRAFLPLVPVLLGFAVDGLAKLGAGVASPIGATGIALAAIVVREIINGLSQHGLSAAGGGAVVFKRSF